MSNSVSIQSLPAAAPRHTNELQTITLTGLTEAEKDFILMVHRHLKEARKTRAMGKAAFEADFHEGGIQRRWFSTHFMDR